MKLTLVLGIFSIWVTIVYCGPVKQINTWEQYKEHFNKKYSSVKEESLRRDNFLNNLKFIELNQGQNGVQLGINAFSDLSDEEFFAKNNAMSHLNESKLFDSVEVNAQDDIDEYDIQPNHFDWRERIRFNNIENQGSCGSCYTFAPVLTVEAAYAIRHHTLIHLSKQELVDCTLKAYNPHYANQGCRMGYSTETYKYIKEHGVYEEVFYPYKALGNEACYLSMISNHNRYRINDFRRLPFNGTDPAMMNTLRTVGPMTVNINDNDPIFKHYKGGIIRNLMPHTRKTTHSVTLVGWGREGNTDYWVIRNSWGEQWGEKGHARIERHKNIMGINNHPVYPILN